jgi:hypothetical protein
MVAFSVLAAETLEYADCHERVSGYHRLMKSTFKTFMNEKPDLPQGLIAWLTVFMSVTKCLSRRLGCRV